MPIDCIVIGCSSNHETGFPFPFDKPETLSKWIKILENRQELCSDYQNKLICAAHFTENDFSTSNKYQLNKKAVPSIFPEMVVDSDNSDENEKNNVIQIKTEPEELLYPTCTILDNENLSSNFSSPIIHSDRVDFDSNYEPSEDEEMNMSLTETDIERLEAMDDTDDDDGDEDYNDNYGEEDESLNETTFRNTTHDIIKGNDTVMTFKEISNEESVDSDYEPVTENCLTSLEEKFNKKLALLKEKENIIKSMEEMIENQDDNISKLEKELNDLRKLEAIESKNAASQDNTNDSSSSSLKKLLCQTESKKSESLNANNKKEQFTNTDLQIFSISLYYFSPHVYSYLESLMPYLPPRDCVIEWVKSGYAFTLFPPGAISVENFILD